MITETTIINAIVDIKADAQVSVREEDVNQITWHDGNPTNITNEQILTKQSELQAIYDSNKYQRDRVLEYPSIGDQLDMIYHSGLGGPEFQSAIKSVKDAHPKGGN